MAYQLPSLNALRAFEASARHLSFKRASQELFVTPGAISQQVKALEEELGVQLFRRLSRKIELTPEGERFLPPIQRAFQNISEATLHLALLDQSRVLKISLPPGFAIKWMIPQISGYQNLHPEIEVHLHSSSKLIDFRDNEFDLAIRFGLGKYSGLQSQYLMKSHFFPVCSPKLKAGPLPLEKPSDLQHHTLLHDEKRKEWPLWINAMGLAEVIDASQGPSFSNHAMLLQATIEGQGVSLEESLLVEKDIQNGLLIKLFDVSFTTNVGYYLVCPKDRWELPKIKQFREWIMEESQKTERVFEEEMQDYSLQDVLGFCL